MKRVVRKIKGAIQHASSPIVPPEFPGYPIASQTSWAPLKSGGANFKTHKFVAINHHRAAFGATVGARLFSLLFGGIGTVIAIFGAYRIIYQSPEEMPIGLIMLIFGGVFAGVGIYLYKLFDKAIIFDLVGGLFWRGKRPNLADSEQKPDTWCRIDEIAGIQILREFVRSDKSSYYSYELNLILQDSSRRHVVDHGSLKQISTDAQQLGEFLQVPVWNGAVK